MGKYPIELGNYVLILLGLVLTCLGPYILYRTALDIRRRWGTKDPLTTSQWGSHAINVLIAALFLFAGVLFVVNNLRGNEFA